MALAALVQRLRRLEQAKLLEPRADAGAADAEGAGDGGNGGLLGPGGDEVDVFEGTRRPAAAAEVASGREVAGSGLVVELAGGSECPEALADGGLGEAELAGDFRQREGTAAAPPVPAGQQLQGVDSSHRAAPACTGGTDDGSASHLRFLRLMRLRAGVGGRWR